MSILTSSPYNLAFGDLVRVEVLAHNTIGWSTASPTNTVGATVRRVPLAVLSPTRGSLTTTAQI